MRLQSITCPNCGAPIEAPIDAYVVTCAFCGSKIRLQRTDTDGVVAQLHEVENDNALMRLDQDWDAQSEQYMIRTKDGDLREPMPFSPSRVIWLLILAGLLASIWAFSPWKLSVNISVYCFFSILFILFLVIGALWNAKRDNARYKAYKAAEDAYQAQRDALTKERMER